MPSRAASSAVRVEELVGTVRLVAGRHGCVRREHAPLADPRERVVERDPGRHVGGRQLESRQGGVALVEVQYAGLDPEGAQRAHAADAEQPVLPEPDRRVPSYRREVIQRSTGSLPGRSVSSRYSGTRPTSTRQTWNATERPNSSNSSRSGPPPSCSS